MVRMPAIRRWRLAVLLGIVASSLASSASAQDLKPQETNTQDEGDHALVLEFGGAGDWSRAEGFHPGGTFAFEVTPIEHWLELEIGFTAIRADASTEMPFDVLFKKPWRLSRQVEFMIGVGPEVVHATGPNRATFWGLFVGARFHVLGAQERGMVCRTRLRSDVPWRNDPSRLRDRSRTIDRPLMVTGGVI
jgi:hypothetical protein